MTIKTVVKWDAEISPEQLETIVAEVDRLKEAEILVGEHAVSGEQIERIWSTTDAAQDWIDFLNGLPIKPYYSAVVEE